MHDPGRRRFLTTATALGAAGLLPGALRRAVAAPAMQRPRLYVTAEKTGTLRSLAEVRAAIRTGHAAALWDRVLTAADTDRDAAPLTPATPLPGRTPAGIAGRNPDYVLVDAAGQRVLRHALVHLVTGEPAYREAALRQIDTLLDATVWPKWMDQAHEQYGHPADLRTGMLARDLGLAYDWLYPALSDAERQRFVAGLDRRAIQPFLTSMAQDPWWIRELNNWVTTIAGGVAVAALAMGDDHPQSQAVLDVTLPLMDAYLERYGPEGEFNECPAYANASERPVMFYAALRYASGGGDDRLSRWPFPHTAYWAMYLTVPPGHIAALGDSPVEARPWVRHIAAVAGAARDGILQDYYLRHANLDGADPLELLWYDPTVEPVSPEGRLPLGRLFPAHAACYSSRTSWDPLAAACVVYGNLSREENHEHNDDGQVCIDGYGERLIVDLGPPGKGYPEGYFREDRWKYYSASVRGHNVLMFGGRERRHLFKDPGTPLDHRWEALRGRVLDAAFDNARGGWWQADLTPTYDGARRVHRTMVHLLPGIVVVLDEADLERPEEISLRWHTADRAAPAADGSFTVRGGQAALAARVVSLDAPLGLRRGEHAYTPPYDRNRQGDPLHQPRESYVEAYLTAGRCRLLTLFALHAAGETLQPWAPAGDAFTYAAPGGLVQIRVTPDVLHVEQDAAARRWSVPLR